MSPLLLITILTLSFFSETESASFEKSFEIVNNCNYTIWPAVVSTSTANQLSTTSFTLKSGTSINFSLPNTWELRVWGRTLCNESSTGNFSCFTGDCGTGKIECGGKGAIPPVTVAEFFFNSAGGTDYYDVSLVDGFNLPMVVEPVPMVAEPRGGRNCRSLGCTDLNGACPKELRVAREGSQVTVACMTPCTAFNNSRFCCTGEYADQCAGTVYTDYFKRECPQALTYEYDNNHSSHGCVSARYYSIVFCPISLDQTQAKEPTVSVQVPSKSKNHKIIIASIASSADYHLHTSSVSGLMEQ